MKCSPLTKPVLLIILAFYFSAGTSAQQKHIFSFDKNDFLLDGKPFRFISGEMHPARIVREYWRNRIQMAKAMGCNTIAAYVFWNYKESVPGVFDFRSTNHDVAAFIRLCQEEKMWVLLRPGPYTCAEWDFGGLPSYLLKTPDIKIRCMDTRFMHAVKRYIDRLSQEIRPLLCTNGGPVIMIQIENEYGSYGNDRKYLESLRTLWLQNGIDVPFYTADGAAPAMLEAGNIEGAAIGLDSGSGDDDFQEAKKRNDRVPSFSSETYPGWLTHWGEKWARTDTNDLKKEITYLLEHNKSFNLYLVHGGTNFGFYAGANSFGPTQYQPDITSYDYDAPINEQGQPTPKFFMLRNLISRYVNDPIPDIPTPVPEIEIPIFTLSPITSIWNQLPAPRSSPQPEPMEAFGQRAGFILYRTRLLGHKSGKLTITDLHDYALIFLDGSFIDTIYRDGGKWTVTIPTSAAPSPQLDILVEGMGRINFGQYMIDRKGITDRVTLDGMTLMEWQTFLLPMDDEFIMSLRPSYPEGNQNGIFFSASFDLKVTGDTYIDMSGFSKGVVWINGQNLGRYWNKGPQYHLFCPGTWLRAGKNQITVFDLFRTRPTEVRGVKTLE
jgi:beta-galactosidase